MILKDYKNEIATIVPDISDIDLILLESFTRADLGFFYMTDKQKAEAIMKKYNRSYGDLKKSN
ncbi:hypothetical protein NWO25_00825 [Enterococcus lactis]|nr:hypothetical protein [Enterococcus lactis]